MPQQDYGGPDNDGEQGVVMLQVALQPTVGQPLRSAEGSQGVRGDEPSYVRINCPETPYELHVCAADGAHAVADDASCNAYRFPRRILESPPPVPWRIAALQPPPCLT